MELTDNNLLLRRISSDNLSEFATLTVAPTPTYEVVYAGGDAELDVGEHIILKPQTTALTVELDSGVLTYATREDVLGIWRTK